MEQITEDLGVLIGTIGPRGACTEAEKRASEYIERRFRDRGLKTTVQEFSAVTTYSYIYLIYVLTAVVCGVLNRWYPYVVAPIAVINALLFICDLETFPALGRLLPKRRSRNVIGEIPAEDGRVEVVVAAHCDSARALLSFHPALVKNFRSSVSLMIGSIVGLGLLSVANSLIRAFTGATNHGVWYASLFLAAYLMVPATLLIHREIAMEYTAGANDNGSGVVTMLGLMDKVSEPESEMRGVMFLATGAEEVGMVGMIHFLREYGERVKHALLINLDNLGKGELKFIYEEGILLPYRSSPVLLWEAEKTAREKSFPLSRASFRLLSTDATPALARDYSAMSVMAFDENGLLPDWHWESDTLENLDIKNLEVARGFLWNFMKRLDPK